MKIVTAVLVWMVIVTEVMMKIAAFISWALILGFCSWLLGGVIRDLYRHIRVKFVPLEDHGRAA